MGRKLRPGIDKIGEDWVKKEVKAILESFDLLMYDMPPAAMYGKTGRHDFIICQRGLFWTIETKAGANTPTPNQIRFAREVADACGMSIWFNEEGIELARKVAQYVDTWNELPTHLASTF